MENKNDKKTAVIEKLQAASNSIEKYTFLNKDLSNTSLNKLNISNALFIRCDFQTTAFYGCTFTGCEFNMCNFKYTDLLNVKFIDCKFSTCDFTESTLQDVIFGGEDVADSNNSAQTTFLNNCIFDGIKKVNNVVGLPDILSNIVSENEEQPFAEGIEQAISQFDTNKVFQRNEDEFFAVFGDIIVSIAKSLDDTWVYMIGYSPSGDPEDFESILSDVMVEAPSVKELKAGISGLVNGALLKRSIYNDYTEETINNIKSIPEILGLGKSGITEDICVSAPNETESIEEKLDRVISLLEALKFQK
jgi:hypothetical protein